MYLLTLLLRVKSQCGGLCTFLTSLVSMQRSIRSTVEMSMYSLHMSFIQLVKLSTVVWKSTQVNFMMLNTLLMMLSEKGHKGYYSVSFKLNFKTSQKFTF